MPFLPFYFHLSKNKGNIDVKQVYTQLIIAPLTVGFGGSVGLLGPAVATGAAIKL